MVLIQAKIRLERSLPLPTFSLPRSLSPSLRDYRIWALAAVQAYPSDLPVTWTPQ